MMLRHGTRTLTSNKTNIQRLLQHKDFVVSVFGTNLTKSEIWKCPTKVFEGNVYIVSQEKDQDRKHTKAAIKRILQSTVVGFDTETAVIFPRRTSSPHLIGLVQIATENDVILWRLRCKKKYIWNEFPTALKRILKDRDIMKVGNGTYDDLKHLYETYNISVSNMVDNQTIAKDIGYNKIGLVALAAQLYGWRINKKEQLSNWEVPELSESQVQYASTDAWVSLKIYQELSKMSKTLQGDENPIRGTSSFDHILRQEAKFDADFLLSLDLFGGKMSTKKGDLNESVLKRQRPRLSFDASDYDLSETLSSNETKLNTKIGEVVKREDRPFVYQAV